MTTLPATGGRPATGSRPASLRMTPGRRVLLAFGVPVILLLIVWNGFSLIATFGTATFGVSGSIPVVNGQVVASFGGGNVTLSRSQAGGSTAQLTGKVQYSLVRPRFSEHTGPAGTNVNLHCRIPTGTCQLSANLAVPAGTGVNLSSQGGDMTVSGVSGDATLSSAGGNVTVSGGGGIADVSTSGGDLTASNLGGIAKFSTGGGNVTGNDLAAPATTINSSGGDVTLVYTKVPDRVNVSSAGGNITVLLPPGSTRYDISDSTGGGDYTASVPAGSSSHTITVNSAGGDITIAQSS
ncbi:MAG: DUF4097 family beta strand repeat-containing protein [Streptosporangiaceae bacterium]